MMTGKVCTGLAVSASYLSICFPITTVIEVNPKGIETRKALLRAAVPKDSPVNAMKVPPTISGPKTSPIANSPKPRFFNLIGFAT